jgi:spore germination protein KB
MNFLLSGIVKITLCLIVAAKGISNVFALADYKRMIMPTSMLVVALCAIVYNSAMEMFGFLKYYQIYAIPFQILIPAVVWITAEIRQKMQAKKSA